MKKFLKKVACLTVMAVTVMSAAMAQDAQPTSADNKKIEFSLHLGGAVPLGDFGDSRTVRVIKQDETNSNVKSEDDDKKYVYIRNITAYFLNWDTWVKSNLEFSLVMDINRKLFVAYKNYGGVTYIPVYDSKRYDFKYVFYMSGYFYFN
ncbi:MAG: hypothetical protein IKJ67_06640 [Bacteroidales bacterium]|nr:hypothetical protein [Bacteroidales bacterium]